MLKFMISMLFIQQFRKARTHYFFLNVFVDLLIELFNILLAISLKAKITLTHHLMEVWNIFQLPKYEPVQLPTYLNLFCIFTGECNIAFFLSCRLFTCGHPSWEIHECLGWWWNQRQFWGTNHHKPTSNSIECVS